MFIFKFVIFLSITSDLVVMSFAQHMWIIKYACERSDMDVAFFEVRCIRNGYPKLNTRDGLNEQISTSVEKMWLFKL